MPRTVGNYALGSLIGRGGMSEVYAAEHRFLGDPVAIKLLRAEAAAGGRPDAFVAEATRTRAIQHPNVVRVLDFGRDEGSGDCYLVMERVDGENLAKRLRRVERLDEDEARRVGAAIADGMAAAHACGIVHRDLKPANVMLRGDDPTIIDFGIATALGTESAVSTGRRIGTPAYMAPEQLTAGLIAPCIDVWALGVILFEAVTGRLPFDGFADGRCPQLFEAAPRAASLAPISPVLDDLIARCLDRDPGRRPASMAAIAAALRDGGTERITQDLGLPPDAPASIPRAGLASSPPTAARARRWPIAAGLAALVAVALAAALAWPSASPTPSPPAPAPLPPAPVEPAPAPAPAPAPPPPAAAATATPPPRRAPPRRERPKPPPPRAPATSQGEGLD